jgi:hypothetical protein
VRVGVGVGPVGVGVGPVAVAVGVGMPEHPGSPNEPMRVRHPAALLLA